MPNTVTIDPRGPFSLRAAAGFGFGPNEGRPPPYDGAFRLAFAVDPESGEPGGAQGYAGVVVRRQAGDDGALEVELTLTATATVDVALAQTARTLSLDHDGSAFAELGASDPVLGALQRAHPGQRPVLFHSPYEAAAWSVLSARRPAAQAAKVRAALGEQLGHTFSLAGATLHAFPQPEALATIPDDFPGLGAVKAQRLRAVAAAALVGELDIDRIAADGPEATYERMQTLPGIGPFYAGLITLRACGFADAWLGVENWPGAGDAIAYYGLDGPERLPQVVARWRPFRTWAMVLVRLAAARGTGLTPGA